MILAKLEISDHDGYCSGNECVYKSKNKKYIRTIPEDKVNKPINDPYWIELLQCSNINNTGSYNCKLSRQCIERNLGFHEYKYTIRKLIFITN